MALAPSANENKQKLPCHEQNFSETGEAEPPKAGTYMRTVAQKHVAQLENKQQHEMKRMDINYK